MHSALYDDFTSAIRVWRQKGARSLFQATISRLESSRYRSSLQPLLTLLNEIDLLIDERSIALPTNGRWKIIKIPEWQPTRSLPTLSSRVANTRHGSQKHLQIMKQLYTYNGYVTVEEGDIVVDVGAYVGGFSAFAATKADHVIAIEPHDKANKSLTVNTAGSDNISVVAKAAWCQPDTLELNTSEHPNENSVLSPDKLSKQTSISVPADTVPNIVRDYGYEKIDYLKIEAEGVEPEILNGALNDPMKIKQIAVDASPERTNTSPYDQIVNILERHGYTYSTKEKEQYWGTHIIFAQNNED